MCCVDGQHNRFGGRILITGTGGQGVLTAACLLCYCFVELDRYVVSGQLHGTAQRGGAVQSSVIIDGGINPVIPSGRADSIAGFEPIETARALPFMSSRTMLRETNAKAFLKGAASGAEPTVGGGMSWD